MIAIEGRLKRKLPILIICCIICVLLFGCGHEHVWTEATCEKPETCSDCGETRGNALGHVWKEASCETPKTCSRCGLTEGEPLGHIWADANYETPKTCSRCGLTEGEPLDRPEVDTSYETQKSDNDSVIAFLKSFVLENGEVEADGTLGYYFVEGKLDDNTILYCSIGYDESQNSLSLVSFAWEQTASSSIISQIRLELTDDLDSFSGLAVLNMTDASQKNAYAGNFTIYPAFYSYDSEIHYYWEGKEVSMGAGLWTLLLKTGINELGNKVLIPYDYSLLDLHFDNLGTIEPWVE